MDRLKSATCRQLTYRILGAFTIFAIALTGCQTPTSDSEEPQIQAASVNAAASESDSSESSHAEHGAALNDENRPELEMDSPIELDAAKGQELGTVFEAFLSPYQEGEEESDTPALAPDVFKSTAPSVPRNERDSRGHGILSFTRDLSKAYVHVAIEGVVTEDIVMFHLHCGRPGQLGPIIVDFALAGDLQSYLEDGIFTLEITNEDIVATAEHGHGIVGAFTAGCPIAAALPTDKVKTVAGMEFIARQGELYFNLHTKGQTFFGDIRGQLYQAK